MIVPAVPGAPGIATELNHEAVGILGNGVLLDSHEQTWSYDSCDGHSNKKGQYHYHIPPSCVLKNMSTEFAGSSGWWKDDDGAMVRAYADMASQFPSSGPPSPIIGRARDGYPIFGLYDEDGKLQRSALKFVASDKKDAQSHGGIGATSFASMMRICFGRGKACASVVNTSFMTGAAHDSSRNHLVVFAQAVVMS